MSKAQKEQMLKNLREKYSYFNMKLSLADLSDDRLADFYNKRAKVEAEIAKLTA